MTAPGEPNPLEGNRYDGIVEYAQVVGLLRPEVTSVQDEFIRNINGRGPLIPKRITPEVRDHQTAGEATYDLIESQVRLVLEEGLDIEDEDFTTAAKELYGLYTDKDRGFKFGREQAIACVALRFIDADPDAQLYHFMSAFEGKVER